MKQNTILKKCWIWNESVANFVKDKIEGYSLNVCAGKNPLCDVNMDLDPQDKKVIRGDMRLLPFKSNTFDTVVSDPPWKISYYERFKPFFECVRVCKVGGKIIYNATWIPMTPSRDVELQEAWVRQDNDFSNASMISIFTKVKNTEEYNKMQEKLLEASQTQTNNSEDKNDKEI